MASQIAKTSKIPTYIVVEPFCSFGIPYVCLTLKNTLLLVSRNFCIAIQILLFPFALQNYYSSELDK